MLTNSSMISTKNKTINGFIGRTTRAIAITSETANETTTRSKLIKKVSSSSSSSSSSTIATTISSDPGILCFHHCNIKVFCFVLPHICPNCKIELDTRGNNNEIARDRNAGVRNSTMMSMSMSTKLLPFRLPYPFVRASQSPCAIVLRPTIGDFLNDYNNTMDLHIALTTSSGVVVEFDRFGLRRHRADDMLDWWQCLSVGDVPEPWHDYWDQVLSQICKQPSRWTVEHYNEDNHNCYAFVLAFLQALRYEKLSAAASSKTRFCEKFIVPRTTTAGKYISLYRKLKTAGIYVHPHPVQHQVQQQQQQQQKKQQQPKNKTNNCSKNVVPAVVKHSSSLVSSNNKRNTKTTTTTSSLTTTTTNTSGIIKRTPTLCTIEE